MRDGFTMVWSRSGRLTLQLTRVAGTPSLRPALVSTAHHRAGQLTLVLLGQLYYREDLLRRLPPEAMQPGSSDAHLALAAYRLGGRRGLEGLEGEFTLALWDGATQKLLALRDPTGAWPLFWLAEADGLAVSTSLAALHGRRPRAAFDLDYLADFLMWPNPQAELPCERTAIEGVRRGLPGVVLEIDRDRRVVPHRFWDWGTAVQPGGSIDPEEVGAECRRLLREAVRQRLGRSPVAAHLSGGMDSSAVACLARDLIGQAGSPHPLHTLSLVYRHPSLAGERAFIEQVLAQPGPVAAHLLPGEPTAPYGWLAEGLPWHDEPYAGLPGAGAQKVLLEEAERHGAVTVLTGLGSDEILDAGPVHIADLVQAGRWLTAYGEARRWAAARNQGVWTVLRRYGLEPCWPLLLREGVLHRWRGGVASWPKLGWFSVPSWVHPNFARRHCLAERGREHARRLYGRPCSHALQANMLLTGAGDWARWYLAAPRGLNLTHPFQDPRLVCFALGLPPKLRAVPGQRKPVLQEATRGLLPEAIRTRRDKRGFNDMYGMGLARSLPQLEQLVRRSALAEMGIVRTEELLQTLHEAALGTGDIRACERLDKTLALAAWLEQAGSKRRWQDADGDSCTWDLQQGPPGQEKFETLPRGNVPMVSVS
jgi:asparagine synthase (glutamine-hydrolysing)